MATNSLAYPLGQPGLAWSVRRRLLMPLLKLRYRASTYRCGPLRIVPVGCSEEEVQRLREFTEVDLYRVVSITGYHLGVLRPLPRFRAVCVGATAERGRLPSWLSVEWLGQYSSAAWHRYLHCMIVLCDPRVSLRRLLVHELAHAILDVWTGGFRYPNAIGEAFACSMETWILGTPCVLGRGVGPPSAAIPPGPVGVRELLSVQGWSAYEKDPERYADTYRWLCTEALWLGKFLLRLDAGGRPAMFELLRGLWLNGRRNADAAYDWLLAATKLSAPELEHRYRYFRSTGVVAAPAAPEANP